MSARHLIAAGIASALPLAATPAVAQGTTYEHVQPPLVPPPPAPAPQAYEYEYDHHGPHAPIAVPYPAPLAAPAPHAGAPYPYPQVGYAHGGAYAPPQHFDRDGWLEDCRRRIHGLDRRERGAVIGGLLGAIAGGVVGNRVWDGERLAGTLLGGGLGALGGLAIGGAVGAASDHRADECGYYLDRHMAAWPRHAQQYGYAPGYGHSGYAYGIAGYAWTTTMVPVMVQIPQRAIVHETVTEEWVEEAIHRPAPRRHAPSARKYVPARSGKYVKGK